jgi:membrane protein implicated in regulation of membrane protease activity
MTGFGWNFYGFFLFAAGWIAAYFAWARWMERRETDTERTRNGHGTNTETDTTTGGPAT